MIVVGVLFPFLFALVEQDSVDVAFDVVYGDERDVLCVSQGLGIGDADEQSAGESGAACDCDRIQIREGDFGFVECGTDYRDDGAQMLAAGEFGDDSAIPCMRGDLGGDHG